MHLCVFCVENLCHVNVVFQTFVWCFKILKIVKCFSSVFLAADEESDILKS